MKNERRKYPRINLAGEVSILVSGIVRTGTLTNVSPSGIQVECRRRLIEQLNQFRSEAGVLPEFELEFTLPTGVPVKASCNVSYCRRLSADIYNLGLNFTRLSRLDEERVDDFIHQAVAA